MLVRVLTLPGDRAAVLTFLDSAISEGDHGLSENKHSLVELTDGRPGTGLIAQSDGQIVGYAGLAPSGRPGEWAMEIVTGRMGREQVAELVDAATATAVQSGARRLRWWTFDSDDHAIPPHLGFQPERELLIMARDLPAQSAPEFGPEFVVRPFRVGEDEAAWLAVNNVAFAGHPENGDLTLSDLERRTAMDWFESDGLRMAWHDDDLAGFCWTKIHPGGRGEIYIIGVDPAYQGRGLGEALVLEGMRHLTEAGCPEVFLYTEGDNVKAVKLYERLGMTVERVHRSFIKQVE